MEKNKNIGFVIINKEGTTYFRNGVDDFLPEEIITKIREYINSNKIQASTKITKENYTTYVFRTYDNIDEKIIKINVSNEEKKKNKFIVETLDDLCTVGVTIKKENKKLKRKIIVLGTIFALECVAIVGLLAEFINIYNEKYAVPEEPTTSIEQFYEIYCRDLAHRAAIQGDNDALEELQKKVELNYPGASEALEIYYELVNSDYWKTEEQLMEEEIREKQKSLNESNS